VGTNITPGLTLHGPGAIRFRDSSVKNGSKGAPQMVGNDQ
jgi:hypothetical protein